MAREGGDKVSIIGTADVHITNPVGQAAAASSVSVVQASDTFPDCDFAPQYAPLNPGGSLPAVDPAGAQLIRGQVLTDEGSYRCNIANSSLAVSIGSCTFAQNSDTVTGTNLSTYDLHVGDYVYLDADGFAYAQQVGSLSDTSITLNDPYLGTGGTGASSRQIVKHVLGTGQSVAVANSIATFTLGSTTGSVAEFERDVDYRPILKRTALAISQRIVNQTTYVGLYDEGNGNNPRWFCWFLFDGTTNTTIKCQTARNPTTAPSAAEIQETVATLPDGLTTAVSNEYEIYVGIRSVRFYINRQIVAEHRRAMPAFHDPLTSTVRMVNGTSPAGGTTVAIDYDDCYNHDAVDIRFPDKYDSATPNAPDDSITTATVSGANQNFAVIDLSQYAGIYLSYTSIGGGCTIASQFSNDPAFSGTPVAGYMVPVGGGAAVTSATAVGMWFVPKAGRYCRIRSTAYTSGSPTVVVQATQVSPAIMPTSLTVTAANLQANVNQIGGTNIVTGGVAGIQAVGGNIAHSTATTANPVPTGGRVVPTTIGTVDVSLVAGDTSWKPISTGYQAITKDFGTSELDWASANSFTPTVWASAATLTQVRPASGTASVRTYVTGMDIQTDALGAATNLWLLDGPVSVTSVTIANPGVFTNSGTNNFKVGDPVVFENLGTITGISANTVYYVTATSLAATTFTVAATSGGTALQITGSTSTPTVYRVLKQVRLQTTALPLTSIQFPSPIKTDPNVQLSAITSSTTTGTVYLNCQGYYGF